MLQRLHGWDRHGLGRQGGWIGLVALLVVALIVVFLAKNALREYGLLSGMGGKASSTEARGPKPEAGTTAVERAEVPAPRDALDRARQVQDSVRQQAADLQQRIDSQTK